VLESTCKLEEVTIYNPLSISLSCALTIGNGETVEQGLAIKPVLELGVPNLKHPRTIAEQPTRHPERDGTYRKGEMTH